MYRRYVGAIGEVELVNASLAQRHPLCRARATEIRVGTAAQGVGVRITIEDNARALTSKRPWATPQGAVCTTRCAGPKPLMARLAGNPGRPEHGLRCGCRFSARNEWLRSRLYKKKKCL